ncbi:hypothetical protein LO772_17530 [Yinghuangia sp. ASG 101]|uniref:hypothetical protein n=1 Tax=Yinghuangia sp. ASG 101 TaxID=2896848 RepID=UPI001E33C700|nr:hypothetical protein [Yinghuangia sp. ASG 101]UGQ15202.1 hypothetical protein LO772_17530 [Yinghuangia sp. ASG 101]
MLASRPLRAARAAVFAAVCVALSAAGHAFMSHEPLPVWALAAGFVVVGAVAYAAAGRERSWAGITALLALGQLALHTLFSLAAATAAPAGHPGTGGGLSVLDRLLCGSRHADGRIVLPEGWSPQDIVAAAGLDPTAPGALPDTTAAGHAAAPTLFDGGLGMLAAHLVAALAAGWWLRRGEAALFGLFRLLRRLHTSAVAPLRTVLALLFGTVPCGHAPAAVRRTRASEPRPVSVHLRHAVVRRGPPAFALAC